MRKSGKLPLTPVLSIHGDYFTHQWCCRHLLRTLQLVVDQVGISIWLPGPCAGNTTILVLGPCPPRGQAQHDIPQR